MRGIQPAAPLLGRAISLSVHERVQMGRSTIGCLMHLHVTSRCWQGSTTVSAVSAGQQNHFAMQVASACMRQPLQCAFFQL